MSSPKNTATTPARSWSVRGRLVGAAAIGFAVNLGTSVIALGGVSADLVRPCLDAGAAGIAVMGEIMRSDQPGGIVTELLRRAKPQQ